MIEEIGCAPRVLLRFDDDRLIVLGAGDDPQVARLGCDGVQQARLLLGNIAVPAAVDEEHRAGRHAGDGALNRGKRAAEATLAGLDEKPAEESPEFRWMIAIDD